MVLYTGLVVCSKDLQLEHPSYGSGHFVHHKKVNCPILMSSKNSLLQDNLGY